MLRHRDVIDKIDEAGYPINRSGMCFGIALMGLQAILLKDTDTLQKRLKLLHQIPKGKLLEALSTVKKRRALLHDEARNVLQAERHKEIKSTDEKVAFAKRLDDEKRPVYYSALSARLTEADKKLTEEDLLLLSIPAYLEGIAIYYAPDNYPQLFENEYSIIVTDDKQAEEKKPETNQIILAISENGSLRCKLISKGKAEEIFISKDSLEEELGKASQEFYAILKSKELAKFKPFITNIINILSKKDPLLKKDPKAKKQDAILTFPRVLPVALMEQKNKDVSTPAVQQVATWSGVYDQKNQKELSVYFNVLAEKLYEDKMKEPVAFLLHSSNHAITVSWEPGKQLWRLVDANRLWLSDKLMTADELANNVLATFSKNGITTFATEVYAASAVAEQVKSAIYACQQDKRWQAIHTVSPKKALAKDSYHGSWLYVIAENGGEVKTFKQLLKAKADVNLKKNDGATPLYIAAQEGQIEIVKLLLEAKAGINKARNDGTTPLYMAAQNGYVEAANILLDQKEIDCEASIRASVDILMDHAKTKDRNAALQALFHKKGVNQKTLADFSPLHAAAFFGHFDIVKALLLKDANPNAVTKNNLSALEFVETLFLKGTNPNAMTKNNISALEFAEAMGHTSICDLLKKVIAEQKTVVPDKTITSRKVGS